MSFCLDIENNKTGIAVDGNYLFVQVDTGEGSQIELFISFSETESWTNFAL